MPTGRTFPNIPTLKTRQRLACPTPMPMCYMRFLPVNTWLIWEWGPSFICWQPWRWNEWARETAALLNDPTYLTSQTQLPSSGTSISKRKMGSQACARRCLAKAQAQPPKVRCDLQGESRPPVMFSRQCCILRCILRNTKLLNGITIKFVRPKSLTADICSCIFSSVRFLVLNQSREILVLLCLLVRRQLVQHLQDFRSEGRHSHKWNVVAC